MAPPPPPPRQELVETLGRHLQALGQRCDDAVRAFVPLQEDVKQRMATATAALSHGGSSAVLEVEEALSQVESVSYLPCCYRWVGDTTFRLRFLVSLALVLRKLLPPEAQENGDEISTCFGDELRRMLGRAIEEAAAEAEVEWVQMPRWPMKFPVAKAMTSFVVEYLAPSAPRMTPRSEHRRLTECPEHSLQPAALLQILYDLKEPFQVRESEEPNVDPVGAVRLTEHWSSLKDLPDKAPPPLAAPLPVPRKAERKGEEKAEAAEEAASQGEAEAPEAKRSRSRSGESLQPKLIKKRKAGAKAEVAKAGNDTGADVAAKKPEPETVDLEKEVEKTPEKSASEKPKARPMAPFHPYGFGMWGHPMAMPPRPGMMPPMGMGMPPPYAMPMKRKKEKKGHKDRDKRDRRETSEDRARSSESRKKEKKKEKKEKKKEKKEKHR
eukprot:Skav236514  [mRNA]  locus=scaffold78:590663:596588:+ [translate_table: standard]